MKIDSKESVFYFSKELDPDDKITDNIMLRKMFDIMDIIYYRSILNHNLILSNQCNSGNGSQCFTKKSYSIFTIL